MTLNTIVSFFYSATISSVSPSVAYPDKNGGYGCKQTAMDNAFCLAIWLVQFVHDSVRGRSGGEREDRTLEDDVSVPCLFLHSYTPPTPPTPPTPFLFVCWFRKHLCPLARVYALAAATPNPPPRMSAHLLPTFLPPTLSSTNNSDST